MKMNVKRLAFVAMMAAGVFSASNLNAQIVKPNEMAVVYYMPYTQVVYMISYEEEWQHPGPFYQYAERYLGTKAVIKQEEHDFRLENVRILTHTVADSSRIYKVNAQNSLPTQLIALTNQGILYGYNVPRENPDNTKKSPSPKKAEEETSSPVMPLMEDQLIASSTAKMAEGAAKQIYHIRETRFNILSGEVEHAPADGKAMERVLAELDKQEKALTALFIGTKEIRKHSKRMVLDPEEGKHVLCRFSKFSGIVAKDDLSGEAITVSVISHPQYYVLEDEEEETTPASKKAPQPSEIVYNLPGTGDFVVEYMQNEMDKISLPIAQWGVSVPLTINLFTGKELPKILFNTQTGNIISIRQ